MKIGIDIDEVVVEFFKKYLKLFNERFEKDIGFEELTGYNIWDITDISKEESLKLAEEIHNNSDNFEDLVEGVRDALIVLSNNHEIYFITSRPESVEEKTKNFLKTLLEGFNFELHFSGGVWGDAKTKGEICHELGISVFVEDNPNYALDCAKKEIKVFLLDKPWNKNYEKHENIIKVDNWKEILEKLESFSRENK